jgi:hypothetical protein
MKTADDDACFEDSKGKIIAAKGATRSTLLLVIYRRSRML